MKLFTVPMTCFAANCYVLVTEKNNGILIDPGAQGDKICAALKTNKVNPVAILLTHAHFDHVGAVKTLLQEYPGITVYLCPKDIATIADTVERRALQWGLIDPQQYHIIPDKELNEGDIIEIDDLSFSVLETPGHTMGSVCIACGDYLFTGDTLFLHDYGRTDLFGGSPEQMLDSLAKLGGISCNYLVMPGHEESTTLDNEREFIKGVLQEYGRW